MYPCVVHPSVTLVHPAKAVGRNEMPFGKDTRVAPSKILLDQDPGLPTGRGDLGVGTPSGCNQSAATISKHLC